MSKFKAFYLVFCAVFALMMWSITYGAILGVFFRDSRILNLTITSNPFAPLVQLWHYGSHATLQKAAGFAVAPALCSFVVAAFVGLRQKTQPLGEASFQSQAELRNGRWFQKTGHVFGRSGRNILRVKDDRHHLIIGPTRSGKGVGYVIPNALSHQGSMLVTDLKGEIYNETAGFRQKQGNQVFLFAPGQQHTHRWNPVDFIRPELGSRTTDIQNMAKILVPQTSQGDGAFWQQMAQRIAAGLISYIHESDFYEGRRNLAEMNSLLSSGVPLQAMLRFIMENEIYLSKFTRDSFNAFVGLPEKTAGSALTELQNALEPFQNERVIAATQATDIDLSAMTRKPISIYLAPNITDISLLRPLLTLFVQQTMNLLTIQHNPKALPVYFLLDEFRQLKKMDEIMQKLPYVAGYNIKLAFIIQDLKNLDEIYGETARHSLLGNCGHQLVLGANDQATADYVSKALGKRTIRYQTESRSIVSFGLNKRTRTEQIRERDLMMPQEVRKMSGENFVLMVEGQSPILGDKLQFFKTEPFKSAVAFSKANIPAVPEADIVEPLPVPAVTEAYKVAKANTENVVKAVAITKAEFVKTEEPEKTERAPNSAVVTAVEVSTDLPTSIPGGTDEGEEIQFRILAAKKNVMPEIDLFGATIKEAAAKPGSARKRRSLEELKQAVVVDP